MIVLFPLVGITVGVPEQSRRTTPAAGRGLAVALRTLEEAVAQHNANLTAPAADGQQPAVTADQAGPSFTYPNIEAMNDLMAAVLKTLTPLTFHLVQKEDPQQHLKRLFKRPIET